MRTSPPSFRGRSASSLPPAMAVLALVAGCESGVLGVLAPDAQPPTLSITEPTDGATVYKDRVVVSGVASDDRGVEQVRFAINGGASQVVAITPAESVAFEFTANALVSGGNVIEVSVADAAGNLERVQLAVLFADTTAPTLSITEPTDGATVYEDRVVVSGVARDDWRVAQVRFAINGGASQVVPITPAESVTFEFIANALAPGGNDIEVSVADAAGNLESVQLAVLFADTTAPVVTISLPATRAVVEPVTIRGNASDDALVSSVWYRVNGGVEHGIEVDAAAAVIFEFQLAGLAAGMNTIAVEAVDGAGNRGQAVKEVVLVETMYVVTRLGGRFSGERLNLPGHAVGTAYPLNSPAHGALWDGTSLRTLGPLPGDGHSRGLGLNDAGVAVGTSLVDINGYLHPTPVRWSDMQPSALAIPAGFNSGSAADVNNTGTIIGNVNFVTYGEGGLVSGATAAALWSEGSARLLPQPWAGARYSASQINDAHEVIGVSWSPGHPIRGVRWVNEQPELLVPLPGRQHSWARGLASNGVVVGWSHDDLFAHDARATLWLTGEAIDLGGDYPATSTIARAVNVHNQVVGCVDSWNCEGVFLWQEDLMLDLSELVATTEWEITWPSDINDAGQILAAGWNTVTREWSAVRLDPVPAASLSFQGAAATVTNTRPSGVRRLPPYVVRSEGPPLPGPRSRGLAEPVRLDPVP
jgi:uncharacterized membrane protein